MRLTSLSVATVPVVWYRCFVLWHVDGVITCMKHCRGKNYLICLHFLLFHQNDLPRGPGIQTVPRTPRLRGRWTESYVISLFLQFNIFANICLKNSWYITQLENTSLPCKVKHFNRLDVTIKMLHCITSMFYLPIGYTDVYSKEN